jgi:molybdopterin molybdotransferase
MPEFLHLLPPLEALDLLLSALPADRLRPTEVIATEDALGRVMAGDLTSPHPLPAFSRSAVDGYAVRATDTFGATAALPAYLSIKGEVPMGASAGLSVMEGEAALVHTGGMIPDGADAVVMIEDTQASRPGEVEVVKPAGVGQHVLKMGEDVTAGETVLERGHRLRPQEIGGLLALGFTRVEVAARPSVAILSTGDEVVPPEADPRPGQVRDVNSYTLAALVGQVGGRPVRGAIIPDRLEALKAAASEAFAANDMLLITAGSSVSARDMTAEVIGTLGAPGVLVHGVALKPGKPTILAVCDGKPVVGLPGNPVSALVVAGLFVAPVLRRMLGLPRTEIAPAISARLTTNLASEAGREDYQPVRLIRVAEGWLAEPVFGKSNLIFTLVRADGLVRIPPAAVGLPAGTPVEVRLF